MWSFKQFLIEKEAYKAQPGESEVVVRAHRTGRETRAGDHWGPGDAARARAYMIATKGHAPEWNELNHAQKSTLKSSKFDAHIGRIKLGNVAHVEDSITHTPEIIAGSLHDAGHITSDHYTKLMGGLRRVKDRNEKYEHLANSLKKHANIDTISYSNEVEAPGKKNYIVLHPQNVRVLNTTKGHINLERGSKHIARF